MNAITNKSNSKYRMIFKGREFGILIGLVLLIIIFSLANHRFLSIDNFFDILRQVSVVGIMACGMTYILVCGQIDLSIGSTYGMAAMLSGYLMIHGISCVVAVLIGLLSGVILGFLNGIIVTYLRVPSIITTLGTQYVARGVALIVTNGGVVNLMEPSLSKTNPQIPGFLQIGSGNLFGVIPNMAIIFVFIILIAYFILHKSILGFWMFAVGGNSNAAKVSGIRVYFVEISAFVIMGFLAAVAGILNFSFLNAVQGTMGQGIEMNVIAAAIIGGASLTGGEATILGTVIGVLIMGVLEVGLVFMGVTSYLQMVSIGFVIIFAVSIDMWTRTSK